MNNRQAALIAAATHSLYGTLTENVLKIAEEYIIWLGDDVEEDVLRDNSNDIKA